MTQIITRWHPTQYTRLDGWLANGTPIKMTRVSLAALRGPHDHSDPQANIDMVIANEEAAQVFLQAFEQGQEVEALFTLVPTRKEEDADTLQEAQPGRAPADGATVPSAEEEEPNTQA